MMGTQYYDLLMIYFDEIGPGCCPYSFLFTAWTLLQVIFQAIKKWCLVCSIWTEFQCFHNAFQPFLTISYQSLSSLFTKINVLKYYWVCHRCSVLQDVFQHLILFLVAIMFIAISPGYQPLLPWHFSLSQWHSFSDVPRVVKLWICVHNKDWKNDYLLSPALKDILCRIWKVWITLSILKQWVAG